MENTRKKVRSKTWEAKEDGFSEENLITVYKSHIRPVAEYASVAWDSSSMITAEQSEVIERQQTQAF